MNKRKGPLRLANIPKYIQKCYYKWIFVRYFLISYIQIYFKYITYFQYFFIIFCEFTLASLNIQLQKITLYENSENEFE